MVWQLVVGKKPDIGAGGGAAGAGGEAVLSTFYVLIFIKLSN